MGIGNGYNIEDRLAVKIIQLILDDVTDRRGLRQAWDNIDEEIQIEIQETWRDTIIKTIIDSWE